MKAKTTTSFPEGSGEPPAVLRDGLAGGGPVVTVRDAKAHLSALLDWVAAGHEVTITSDGRPKARLTGSAPAAPRVVFGGMGGFLLDQPVHRGASAADLIRSERDERP